MQAHRVSSFVLVLIASLWIALSQPNLPMSGVCMSLALVSFVGLLSLERIVFLIPFPVLAAFVVASIFASPVQGFVQEVIMSLQLLLAVYTAGIGGSSIFFDRIFRRMKEPIDSAMLSSAKRALKRYFMNLSGIIAVSFMASFFFLFLGSLASFKLEPLFLVAIATAILLLSLIFLGTNLPSSTTQKGKS